LGGLAKTDGNTIRANGNTWVVVKNNPGASAAPTVNEDSDDGYSVGSRWYDTTNDKEYVCLDASVGAAVWKDTTASGSGSGVGAIWAMAASSSQTLTNNTLTQITFDTSVIDSGDSVIDLANERFVAPATGLYLCIAHWCWEDTVPGSAFVQVSVDGTAVPPLARRQAGTMGNFGSIQATHPLSLSVGDLVTMWVQPGAVTGVTSRGSASSHLRSQFSLVRLT
jgi:hypothetical protein